MAWSIPQRSSPLCSAPTNSKSDGHQEPLPCRKERYLVQKLHFCTTVEFLLTLKPSSFRMKCNLFYHPRKTARQLPNAHVPRLCFEGEIHWWHQQKFLPCCPSPFLNVLPHLNHLQQLLTVYRRRDLAGSCLSFPEIRQV